MPPTSNKQNISIPLAIILAGAMIAGAIYLGGSRGGSVNNQDDEVVEINIKPVNNEDHLLGNPNAEVVIVEYSDLECPFCKIFHNTMHQIVEEYEGRVAWVYRHYPIVELHSKAPKEAEASECAFEQGGNSIFWKYIDEVFRVTQSNDSLNLAELPRIAGTLGLDVPQFNECLSSGKYTDKIKQAVADARESGARGTPYSVIISGKTQIPINGAEPIESVRAKIDSVLK